MVIQFKINNKKNNLLFDTIKEFDNSGLIGRSPECDWVIIEEKNVISGKHAKIELYKKDFYIEDMSTNGVFMNGSPKKLGKETPIKLKTGDSFRIGIYNIDVTILPEKIKINEKIKNELPQMQSFAQSSSRLDIPKLSFTEPYSLSNSLVEAIEEPLHSESELKKNIPILSDSSFYQSFLRGAGIEEQELYQTDPHYVLEMAGRILSEYSKGLVELSRTRLNLKNDLKVSRTLILSDYLNPIKHIPSSREVMIKLLSRRKDETWKSPLDSIREVFEENKLHMDSITSGFQGVINKLVETLNPDAIEEQLQENILHKMMSSKRKAECWDRIKDEFKKIVTTSEKSHFVSVLKSEFEKSYEKKSQERR